MNLPELDFFDAVVHYETAFWNHLERALADAGAVTLATLEALRVVERHDGTARVSELQDELRISVGAASKLADRLERDRLATRQPNPADRRSSVIALTPLGRERHDEARDVAAAAIARQLIGRATEAAATAQTLRDLLGRLEGVRS